MSMKEQLVAAIADMKEQEALRLARAMIDGGEDPRLILDAGSEAMAIVGDRFQKGKYFLPELMLSGEMMKQIANMVKPVMTEKAIKSKPLGKVVIGTIAGDIHNIGKDTVAFMLEVSNFEVHDLGVDVPPAKFVECIREVKPDVVGMSGFLTMAFDQMKLTVGAISEAGLRKSVKIMIGGSIMDEKAAEYAGADAYGRDATVAVELARSWMGEK